MLNVDVEDVVDVELPFAHLRASEFQGRVLRGHRETVDS